MKKQTKVLVAAALFTLGASFSSLAALKNGTWVNGEEGWQYFDKEGEVVEGEWCLDGTTEFWINEDGILAADEWVEEGDHLYYAGGDGAKTINEWKKLYAPDDEDQEEEENWYYFDVKGRAYKNAKKTINGETYFFDEEGKMLTGWVQKVKRTVDGVEKTFYEAAEEDQAAGNIYFCNEDGALVKKAWLESHEWGLTEEQLDDLYDDDMVWYYLNKDGQPQKGKANDINGYTYIFDNNGVMLTKWIGKTDDGFVSFDTDMSDAGFAEVYYADADNGDVKKNTWKYLEAPHASESKEFWYYFDKNGKAFIPEATSSAYAVKFVNGDTNEINLTNAAINYTEKRIDGANYLFDADGKMLTGLINIDGVVKYYGTKNQGTVQTGKQIIADADDYEFEFFFATKASTDFVKGQAAEGNVNGYCYSNGQLMTSGEDGLYAIVEAAGEEFIVNNSGKTQHNDGKKYELVNGKVVRKTFNDNATGNKEDSIAGEYTEN